MSTDLKTMMDDVAAGATRGLRVDVVAVRARASERRREVRRRAVSVMTTAAAVAATIVLAVVLLPGSSPTGIQPAARARTGLPDRWYYSPQWTPPVTRHPMPAASMVVSTNLNPDFRWSSITGPVLISADGRHYASLPWNEHASLVALSRDGRRVAWVTRNGGPSTIHRIELATGKQRDAELPGNHDVDQLVWAGSDLYAGVAYGTPERSAVWRLPAVGDPVRVCACADPPLAADARGRLLQPVPASGGGVPGAATVPGLANGLDQGNAGSSVVTGRATVSPDGTKVAVATNEGDSDRPRYFLSIDGPGGRRIPLTGPEPVTYAEVLAWAPGGVLLRVSTMGHLNPSRSLRLYDPVSGAYRIVSKPRQTSSVVLAVADDVLGSGVTVPGVRPEFSSTDRSHVRFLIGLGWSGFGGYRRLAEGAGFMVLIGGIALAVRRYGVLRWRRDQSAQSSGGAGPAGDGG